MKTSFRFAKKTIPHLFMDVNKVYPMFCTCRFAVLMGGDAKVLSYYGGVDSGKEVWYRIDNELRG
jgi:hypothetical protein